MQRRTQYRQQPAKSRTSTAKSKPANKRKPLASTLSATRVTGLTVGKTCDVKLAWTKEFTAEIGPGNDWTAVVQPLDGTRTYPVSGTPASMYFGGSFYCSPLGSQGSIAINEDYPSGLLSWSQLYNEAIVYASSIHVSVMPVQTDAATVLPRYCLVPRTGSSANQVDYDEPNRTTAPTAAQMNALGFTDWSSMPGAISGFVRSNASGPTEFSSYRTTKSMLGAKDTRDIQDTLRMILPKTASDAAATNSAQETQGWLWCLRFFNYQAVSDTSAFLVTVRIVYYTQLQDRAAIEQVKRTVA